MATRVLLALSALGGVRGACEVTSIKGCYEDSNTNRLLKTAACCPGMCCRVLTPDTACAALSIPCTARAHAPYLVSSTRKRGASI